MKLLKSVGEIQKARFACKVHTIEELRNDWSQTENSRESYKITELAVMTNEEYNEFKNNMLNDWDFLNGKGGTSSTAKIEGIEGKEFWELTQSQQAEIIRGAYRVCIGVTTPEANEMLVVDPQGYNYARYVAIIEG